jgi:hypothetical protein
MTIGTARSCGCALNERGLFVDGRLRGDLIWGNMCASCFAKRGEFVLDDRSVAVGAPNAVGGTQANTTKGPLEAITNDQE